MEDMEMDMLDMVEEDIMLEVGATAYTVDQCMAVTMAIETTSLERY